MALKIGTLFCNVALVRSFAELSLIPWNLEFSTILSFSGVLPSDGNGMADESPLAEAAEENPQNMAFGEFYKLGLK